MNYLKGVRAKAKDIAGRVTSISSISSSEPQPQKSSFSSSSHKSSSKSPSIGRGRKKPRKTKTPYESSSKSKSVRKSSYEPPSKSKSAKPYIAAEKNPPAKAMSMPASTIPVKANIQSAKSMPASSIPVKSNIKSAKSMPAATLNEVPQPTISSTTSELEGELNFEKKLEGKYIAEEAEEVIPVDPVNLKALAELRKRKNVVKSLLANHYGDDFETHSDTWYDGIDADDWSPENKRQFHFSVVKNKQNVQGAPLHFVAKAGYADLVEPLIACKANVNVDAGENYHAYTPLHVVTNGETCLELIKHGGDITAIQTGKITPLHAASENGYCDVVQVLCDMKADLSALTGSGKTPLHYAADRQYDRENAVNILLEAKADVNILDVDGHTPVSRAINSHEHVGTILPMVANNPEYLDPNSAIGKKARDVAKRHKRQIALAVLNGEYNESEAMWDYETV